MPPPDVWAEPHRARAGLSLAFRRLDRIRDQTIWWEEGAEPVELLRSGGATRASGYNGRFFHAQVIDGEPLSIVWDSALLEFNHWAIPKGAPDRALAEKLIRFATTSERLGAMVNSIFYGPARISAQRRVGLHVTAGIPMRPHLPTAPRHLLQAIIRNYAWYARTAKFRHRRFNEWLESSGVSK